MKVSYLFRVTGGDCVTWTPRNDEGLAVTAQTPAERLALNLRTGIAPGTKPTEAILEIARWGLESLLAEFLHVYASRTTRLTDVLDSVAKKRNGCKVIILSFEIPFCSPADRQNLSRIDTCHALSRLLCSALLPVAPSVVHLVAFVPTLVSLQLVTTCIWFLLDITVRKSP
jgi:hypothetical protein